MGAERASRRTRLARLAASALLAAGAVLGSSAPATARGAQLVQEPGSSRVDRSLDTTLLEPRDPAAAPADRTLPQELGIDLQSRLKDVAITHTPRGDVVRVVTGEGAVFDLTPEEYVRALGATQARVEHSGFLYRILNISRPWSLAWVCVGFLGQAMFTFRMVLQWWASEKHKRSVVPVGFWWGSLIGGAMLFAYFCWRKDIVGIVGQSTGVFIYARNLVLIYRGRAIEAEGARPVEAEVARPRTT